MEPSQVLNQAAFSVLNQTNCPPPAPEVVAALLQLEKTAKREKSQYSLAQLAGTWRLCLITGTRKTRAKAGIILGAGRYLPPWVKIQLTYTATGIIPNSAPVIATGTVENHVQVKAVQFALTGPIKFLPPKNILAFDFNRMSIQVLGLKLYDGWIRGGQQSQVTFTQERISHQAFFAYFWISQTVIAARGRGGGLALWGKVPLGY